MADPMDAIYIPQLIRALDQSETVQIKGYLADLETLTPVQGAVQATHRGNYLEVIGNAETIVTLTCDRCLQQYNHRLNLQTSEVIWLEDPVESAEPDLAERELTYDELVESLPPQGYFRPDQWLYEQLCLEIPPRKLCNEDCSGIELSDALPISPPLVIDHRWASLEAIKKQMLN